MSVVWVAVSFVLCSAVILFAGVRLSRYGDIIAEKTGLGRVWVGVLLMAAVTSLPELVTGASAVLLFKTPDIAVGDVLGSCMFNLAILAWLDFRQPGPLSAGMHQGHVLAAGFGLVQLGIAGLAMLAGARGLTLGWLGVESLVLLGSYVIAMRTVFLHERTRQSALAKELAGEIRYADVTVRRAVALYAANGVVLAVAAGSLPGLAAELATQTGIGATFIGSLLVAISTSMPEIVVSAAAARLGAVDMAVGNLLGSNIFNAAILGVDDLLYTAGPLLATASPLHLVTIVSGMVMTAITIIGVTYRAQRKRFRLSWDSIAAIGLYLTGVALLWRLS